MKLKTSILLSALLLIVSCSNPQVGEYRIHGTITDPALNGAKIFLVPLVNDNDETVDSVVIADGRFEFRGQGTEMRDIRIEAYRRYGMQNLLVVTEPGDISVTIGPVSFGGGTPQNDSLQMWKEWLTTDGMQCNRLRSEGRVQQADSLHRLFRIRTADLTDHLGEGPLHDFLQQYYPRPK